MWEYEIYSAVSGADTIKEILLDSSAQNAHGLSYDPFHVSLEQYWTHMFRPPFDSGYYLLTYYQSASSNNYSYLGYDRLNAITSQYGVLEGVPNYEVEYIHNASDNVRSVLVGDPSAFSLDLLFAFQEFPTTVNVTLTIHDVTACMTPDLMMEDLFLMKAPEIVNHCDDMQSCPFWFD